MAHFLEHLVFKGGQKYADYRAVNEAAERIGAVLNAYTSHDLVAFHITARAERGLEAVDLLTDFVAQPRIDGDEMDRERGVVVQEIARSEDQPAVMAEHLIDQAVFGDHPLGRPVLGPAEHIRDTFTREGIVAFRKRRWTAASGRRVRGRQPGLARGRRRARGERSSALTPAPSPGLRGRPGLRPPPARPRARFQPVAPAHVLPPVDRRHRSARARRPGHLRDAARRLDGLAPVRRDPRAARPGLLGQCLLRMPTPTCPILQLSAGLDSSKCIEAYRRMRDIVSELRDDGPTEAEVERARAFAAGARAIAFENSGAVARFAAQQTIVHHSEEMDPDHTISCSTPSPTTRSARSRPGSPTSWRSRASVRTPWRSWRRPETPAAGGGGGSGCRRGDPARRSRIPDRDERPRRRRTPGTGGARAGAHGGAPRGAGTRPAGPTVAARFRAWAPARPQPP